MGNWGVLERSPWFPLLFAAPKHGAGSQHKKSGRLLAGLIHKMMQRK
jgi:hypothetical protein